MRRAGPHLRSNSLSFSMKGIVPQRSEGPLPSNKEKILMRRIINPNHRPPAVLTVSLACQTGAATPTPGFEMLETMVAGTLQAGGGQSTPSTDFRPADDISDLHQPTTDSRFYPLTNLCRTCRHPNPVRFRRDSECDHRDGTRRTKQYLCTECSAGTGLLASVDSPTRISSWPSMGPTAWCCCRPIRDQAPGRESCPPRRIIISR